MTLLSARTFGPGKQTGAELARHPAPQLAHGPCARHWPPALGARLSLARPAVAFPHAAADAYIDEYKLAGLDLADEAQQQLRSWYLQELLRQEEQRQRQQQQVPAAMTPPATAAATAVATATAAAAAAAAEGVTGPRMKELPAAPVSSRTTNAKVTLLYDLEAIKPFTQQAPSAAPSPSDTASNADTSASAGAAAAASSRGGGGAGGARGGGQSRLAAAGLVPSSSPDLVAALDQLVRTLAEYGAVHAVHLFLRESTLAKAPALRKQVQQLCTWVEPEELAAGAADPPAAARGAASRRPPSTSSSSSSSLRSSTPSSTPSASTTTTSSSGSTTSSSGGVAATAAPATPHDCPLCRTCCATRLDLLSHFATTHQAPVLAATAAADPRARIMWTRGRPLSLTLPQPVEAAEAGAGQPGAGQAGAVAGQQLQVSPQDFVFAREALQRGRHLDSLLAAAPPTTLSIAADKLQSQTQAQHGPLQPQLDPLQPSPQHRQQQHRPQQRPQQEQQEQAMKPDAALGGPGLFLHVLPAGQPGSALPGALMRVAQRLAQQVEAEAETLLPAAAAAGQAPRRGRGALLRGRGAGRRLAMAEAAAAGAGPPRYLCVVSDGEELDQAVASLKRPGVGVIAVTRTTRVPSATAALRWWAVQGGEYRLRRKQLELE